MPILVYGIRRESHAWVAQLVEHFPEEEGVAGSIPAPSTKEKIPAFRRGFFSLSGL